MLHRLLKIKLESIYQQNKTKKKKRHKHVQTKNNTPLHIVSAEVLHIFLL